MMLKDSEDICCVDGCINTGKWSKVTVYRGWQLFICQYHKNNLK